MNFRAQALSPDRKTVLAFEDRECNTQRECEEFRIYFARISGREPAEILLCEVGSPQSGAIDWTLTRGQ